MVDFENNESNKSSERGEVESVVTWGKTQLFAKVSSALTRFLFVQKGMNVRSNTGLPSHAPYFILPSQGAVFLEGSSVRGVTQVTTQPKLGAIQRRCQEMAEWDK